MCGGHVVQIRAVEVLNSLNQKLGNLIAWLTLAMALVTVLLVCLRYLFESGNLIALQETLIYLHATTFMLGAGWTLGRGGHVRVDVFYRRWSPRTRNWIDALGTLLFLLPVSGFIFFSSLEFVGQSWRIGETSPEPGGIPALYLLKSLIPAMAVLLFVQGLVELARSALALTQTETAA